MREFKEKIVKVKPLIRARKAQLDQQAVELATIRQEKAKLLDELEVTQRAYIEGVDELNRQRQRPLSSSMDVYERGLDYVKEKWYRAMANVRQIEREEQIQLARVLHAQKNLKAVEVLDERYHEDLRVAENQHDQKNLDEISARMFRNR